MFVKYNTKYEKIEFYYYSMFGESERYSLVIVIEHNLSVDGKSRDEEDFEKWCCQIKGIY